MCNLSRCLSTILAVVALIGTTQQFARTAASDDGGDAAPAPVHRVFPLGTFPQDERLQPDRTLRDAYHPWSPPKTLEAWEAERERIRTQLLVACGLWPLPEKTPLKPVIHGRVDRDDYTVERVFFASRPGQYVTGSLYSPKGVDGPRPGVLCPHGHWANGRFYDAGEDAAAKQIESGAEELMSAARYPLQARMVQLARMGCVVFHYDMIGYADNGPVDHRSGFSGAEAELRSQNIMGLQTWNSIRALDFLAGLPDVDQSHIAVTGASGGGTQTFVLCAIDPRPAVAFPAVMVSTAMQGGCVCENASYLRLDLNNVAFAACFAPKPLAMSGANDWTIDIETKGLPELKQVWSLYGKPELVHAECFPQFGHNYNRVSRTLMYGWLNRHLGLGKADPIEERDFTPLTQEEMTVFTAEHARPDDALIAEQLKARLTDESLIQFAKFVEAGPDEYQRIVRPATEVFFGGPPPVPEDVRFELQHQLDTADGAISTGWCQQSRTSQQIPWVLIEPANPSGEVTVWIDGRGKQALFEADGRPISAARKLLEKGQTVLSADVLLTGEYLPTEVSASPPVNSQFAGYTFGYSRPLIADRVRDILTMVALAESQPEAKSVHLLGTREAAPWVLLARGQLGERISGTLVDLGDFSFAGLTDTAHPDFLPGALKFGGLGGLLAANGPVAVEITNAGEQARRELQPQLDLGGEVRFSSQRMTPARDR